MAKTKIFLTYHELEKILQQQYITDNRGTLAKMPDFQKTHRAVCLNLIKAKINKITRKNGSKKRFKTYDQYWKDWAQLTADLQSGKFFGNNVKSEIYLLCFKPKIEQMKNINKNVKNFQKLLLVLNKSLEKYDVSKFNEYADKADKIYRNKTIKISNRVQAKRALSPTELTQIIKIKDNNSLVKFRNRLDKCLGPLDKSIKIFGKVTTMFEAGGLAYRMNSSAGTKRTVNSNNCLTDKDYEDNIKYFTETKGQLNDLMDLLGGVAGKVPAVGKIFDAYTKCVKGFDPMVKFTGDYGRKVIRAANGMKQDWDKAFGSKGTWFNKTKEAEQLIK